MLRAKMRKILTALAIVTFSPLPALAELSCSAMLMPAGQLKQVSRGVTQHHSGLDLVAPHGSPLRAAAAGTVVFAGTYFDYGLMVDIQHGAGMVTRYAHMAGFAIGIRPGMPVAAGDLLGRIGNTGRATTAHVHFEVRIDGRPVDPKPYLALAACTPRSPALRIEEAHAPARPAAARNDVLDVASVLRAPRQAELRPGGLLD